MTFSYFTTSNTIFLGIGIVGLVVGSIFGYMCSVFLLVSNKNIRTYFKIPKTSILLIAKKYKNFPKYDVFAMFTNLFANQLPLLVFGGVFSAYVLGLYALTYKVLMQPINLLSTPILNVFQQKATEDYYRIGNFEVIYKKTFKYLVVMVVAVSLEKLTIIIRDQVAIVVTVAMENWLHSICEIDTETVTDIT